MIRATLVVLGIGAVVTGLAPIAQAQSVTPSSANNSSVTLSGESLRAIDNRTISGDYQTFFNETSSVAQNTSGTNVGRITESPSSSPVSDVVGEQVDVVVGDTLNSQNTATWFPPAGEVGDRERVKVQLQLGE